VEANEGELMTVRFNHTIVHSRDKKASATFLADVLGVRAPHAFGHFLVVELDDGASLDFVDAGGTDVVRQHYAFLIDEADFDAVFGRVRARDLAYWADPFKQRPGEINRHDGGRGVYFEDLDGHLLEVLTRPYGSGGATS
jgi:catechol 2,3-dioxygenase-like lactoylglutathione lyase family enzyme